MTTAPPKLIGTPVRRREDPRLITGGATYVDDVKLVGVHYMALVRSPHAHARIRSVNTSAAKGMPGVIAVWTHNDIKHLGPLPVAGQIPGMQLSEHYPLAGDKVRHVGDPVAAVVATDPYAARDAAMAVQADYEPLPATVDLEEAVKPGAPILHEQFTTNVAYVFPLNVGDLDGAFAGADRVVSGRFYNQRLIPLAMEPRGSVALWEPGPQHLTLWASTQGPHIIRSFFAKIFDLPENQVRVIAPEVGGGFGSKLDIYPDEVLTAFAAKTLGVPVKFTEERSENFRQTIHGRDQVEYVEAAVKNDGTVVGLKLRLFGDLGAYAQLVGPAIPTLTVIMAVGPYKIQNLSVELITGYTNKTPTDAYRGAGRPEATYILERTMDLIAHDLGLDPVEVRRKNLLDPGQFPYSTPTGLVYDSGNYQLALDKAVEVIDYPNFRAEQARLRQQGRYVGLGLATYVEICGIGPSSMLPWGGWESATVRVEPSGKVTVLTGSSPHGQGIETAFAQIVADGLGVPIEDIQVVHGDTDKVQYGLGTYGSRSMAVGGAALSHALVKVRDKAALIAASMLEANPDDVALENGRFGVRGSPDKSLSIVEIAEKAYRPVGLPPEIEPGLEGQFFYEPTNCTYPFGAHFAVVEVDAATGKVTLQRFVAVDDCGEIINPMLVHGQIHGGIAQGAAQALLEEVIYDENGQLLTGSLMDYAAPRADDLPSFELYQTVTPTPVNPLGAKGVGEAGTIGSTPAIANAVIDALAPFGVRHLDMPYKSEKVWRAMQAGR